MVQTWTHGTDMDLLYRHGLIVQTWTYSIYMDLWQRHGLMFLTTPMLLTQTHVIVNILPNHTHTRGWNVARMRDFFKASALQADVFCKSKCPLVCLSVCSQISKIQLIKGVTLPRPKGFFFTDFFHFFAPLTSLFAPTSQSPMSKLFRSLESLGKSSKKKWSHI